VHIRVKKNTPLVARKNYPSYPKGFTTNYSNLDNHDIGSLKAFRAFLDAEFDTLALLQGSEAVGLDRAKVHENIRTALALNEAVTLARIEPLYRASYTFVHFNFSLM